MKRLRYYQFTEGLGFVETTPEASTDRIGSLYVECAGCPVLVPDKPNGLVARKWTHDENGIRRPYCRDCTHEIEEAQYLAESEAAQSAYEQAEDARARWGG